MMVDTKKQSFCVNQIIGQKTEIILVEGDCIVPDIKPDILNAVQTNGNVFIGRREVMDGKIKLDGNIEMYIIYLADDERNSTRSLCSSISFSQMFDFEKCRMGMKLNEDVRVKNIECKVLNGRKVSIKASLEVEMTIYSNDNIEVIESINDIDDVQFLKNNLEINSLSGEGANKVYAKETIKIDNIDFLAEVLKVDVAIMNKDVKVSYNKILTKADAEVKIMYLTEDDRISSTSGMIPIIGFVDIPSVTDEHTIDLRYKMRNIMVKPNPTEEQSVYIELEMDLNAMAYENKRIDIIQDLYSPSRQLKCKQRRIPACTGRNFVKDMCTVKDKIMAPELSGSKIYDVKVNPCVTNKRVQDEKLIIEGSVDVGIMFSPENTQTLNTHSVTIPYTHEASIPGITTTSNVQVEINIENRDLIILPEGSSDIKIDMSLNLDISKSSNINIIDGIDGEEERTKNPYNMTIYFVKKADTLWDIAKKFGSTMEDIAIVNEVESPESLFEGQQLFIPKFQKKIRSVLV